MIKPTWFDTTTIALHDAYAHKEVIKSFADWPDVRFHHGNKLDPTDPPCWLIHARLYDKLAAALGQYFAPLDDAFLAALPPPEGAQPERNIYAEAERRDARLRKQKYAKRKVAA